VKILTMPIGYCLPVKSNVMVVKHNEPVMI